MPTASTASTASTALSPSIGSPLTVVPVPPAPPVVAQTNNSCSSTINSGLYDVTTSCNCNTTIQ